MKTKKLVMLISIMLCALSMHAQQRKPTSNAVVDTIPCVYSNVTKIVETPSKSGKTVKIYAVYKDGKFEDLIPISNSVYEYITLCKETGITPNLGIRLKNGQPVSLIKYKRLWQK